MRNFDATGKTVAPIERQFVGVNKARYRTLTVYDRWMSQILPIARA
jgi:hypothetical protein